MKQIWNTDCVKQFAFVEDLYCSHTDSHVVVVLHKTTRKPFVLKEYKTNSNTSKQSTLSGWTFEEALAREITHLQCLSSHSHIGKLLDVCTFSRTLSQQITTLQFEYLDGGELFDKKIDTDGQLVHVIQHI